jgi:hypothetical protein
MNESKVKVVGNQWVGGLVKPFESLLTMLEFKDIWGEAAAKQVKRGKKFTFNDGRTYAEAKLAE